MIGQSAPVDPTKGISASIDGGTQNGTDLNDNLRGGHGSEKLARPRRRRRPVGRPAPRRRRRGGPQADRHARGGAGNDTVYGGRGTNNIFGGDGNDYLQGGGLKSADRRRQRRRHDQGHVRRDDDRPRRRGNDTVTAIIARGRATVSCGPGVDTYIESRFAGNRKLVKIAGDCEKRKRH